MTRALRLALGLVVACTPSPPRGSEPAPEVAVSSTPRPSPASPSGLTLTVREVRRPEWRGRLVAVSLTEGEGRHVWVVPSERPRPLQELVAAANPPQPFAAINGGFYDTDNAPMGLVRVDGRDLSALSERGGSGVLFVRRGVPRVVHRDLYAPAEDVSAALQSIDRLTHAGVSLVGAGASERRAARSAIALDAAGALHLVVAFDERAVVAETESRIVLGADAARTGPTIAEWAELLLADPSDGGVAARDALGLDGGLSTSLVVKSEARALSIVPYHATINAVVVGVNEG